MAASLALVVMPLSSPSTRRALKHTRAIQFEAFARDDGLWDVDAHITDIKTRHTTLASGVRAAGQPGLDLWLRITVDVSLNIVDAEAVSDAVPYPNFCDTIAPDYKKLIGLNLLKGFRDGVRQRFSDIKGCTHLTELAAILPPAVIQAFAGEVQATRDGANADEQTHKPFQLDRCHAFRWRGGRQVLSALGGQVVSSIRIQ